MRPLVDGIFQLTPTLKKVILWCVCTVLFLIISRGIWGPFGFLTRDYLEVGSGKFFDQNPWGRVDSQLLFWSLGMMVYLGAVCCVGYYGIFKRIFKFSNHGPSFLPLGVAGCFALGYLILVAINRILTLVFPVATSAWMSLLILVLLILSTINWRGFRFPQLKFGRNRVLSGLVFIVIFTLFLILHLKIGSFFMTGDGTSFYLWEVLGLPERSFQLNRLPLFAQHSDELMFLIPFFSLWPKINPLWGFWILSAIGKSSLFILAYIILLKIFQRSIPAMLATMILFFGSNSFPEYSLHFDAFFPIGMSLHFSRPLAFIFPLCLVVLGINNRNNSEVVKEVPSRRVRYTGRLLFLLMGLGFSQISMHGTIF